MLTRVVQAAIILLAGTTTLAAQTAYPTRPVTMVVAFAAGGSTDLIARVLAQRMGSLLGQTVIIENKGGADGAIGSAGVARATPDGYTIIQSTTSTHVINPLHVKTIAESGLPAFEATSWWAVFAPPKTPPEIVAKLNAVIRQALTDPKLLETFAAIGLEVWQSSPEELAKPLVDERAKWQKVIADNKIEIN